MANHKKLGHAEFYAVCEALKKHKGELAEKRMTLTEAAAFISTVVKFPVADSTMSTARDSTGIIWTPTRKTSDRELYMHHAIRAINRAVRELYMELGRPIPTKIESLYQHFIGKGEGDDE